MSRRHKHVCDDSYAGDPANPRCVRPGCGLPKLHRIHQPRRRKPAGIKPVERAA